MGWTEKQSGQMAPTGQLLTAQSRPRRLAVAMAGIMLAYFLSNALMWMVPVALPRTAADLNGMALFSWAIAATALTTAAMSMIFGKLSDLYGRRSILVVALALLALGSALCALSQDMLQFVIARAVQGLGLGALFVLSFAVLGDLFPSAERGKWASLLNVAMAVAAFAGPILAGVLTDALGWRYVFWFFVPVAVLAAVVVWIGVPTVGYGSGHKIDYPGSALLVVASTVMLLAFSWAGSVYPWGSPQIVGVLGGSFVLWGIFVWVESRATEPMLAPSVLTNRIFLVVSVAAMLSQIGVQGIQIHLPLFLQGVQGQSATVTGQLMTPFNLMMAFTNIASGLILARFKRYRRILTISYTFLTLSLLWVSRFHSDTSTLLVILASGLFGLGLGLQPTINTLVVQNAAPREMLGQVTGANYFFVMIGGAFASAILGSTMNSGYKQALPAHLPAVATNMLDSTALASLKDPGILLSASAMEALQKAFTAAGSEGQALFQQTILGVRGSLEGTLAGLFLLGAVVMIAATLLIVTVPEIPLADTSVTLSTEPVTPEKTPAQPSTPGSTSGLDLLDG